MTLFGSIAKTSSDKFDTSLDDIVLEFSLNMEDTMFIRGFYIQRMPKYI